MDGHYTSNYEYSEIRDWLNDDEDGFYASAFGLADSIIEERHVDNSQASTGYAEEAYVCGDTDEKVFLLSFADLHNSDYGFDTAAGRNAMRYAKTTDWARARGVEHSASGNTKSNGWYWTRSPAKSYSDYVRVLNVEDNYFTASVGSTRIGTRPGISITIA